MLFRVGPWLPRQRDEVLCNMNVSIRREFVVEAPLERAWEHLARVEAWPSWAKHIKSVTVEPSGELSPSTVAVFHLAYGLKARFAAEVGTDGTQAGTARSISRLAWRPPLRS